VGAWFKTKFTVFGYQDIFSMEMMSDEFSDPLSTGGIGARCIDEVNSQVKYSKVDAPVDRWLLLPSFG